MRRAIGVILVLAAAAAPLAPLAAADVLVTTLDGKAPVRGISLRADAKTVTVQTAAGPVIELKTADVVEIVTVPAPAPLPPATRPFEVELTDGSRIRGILRQGDSRESLGLRSAILNETSGIRLLIDDIRTIRRVDGTKIPGASRLVRIPDDDAAYRLSGARVQGLVDGFTNTEVVIGRGNLGQTPVPYRDLAVVFIDNDAQPPPDELHVVARLVDGSAILLMKGFGVAAGQLRGETPSGKAVVAPVARVAALSFRGGRFVHLSDLAATNVERTPFFPVPDGPTKEAMLEFVCPVRMDRSPDGSVISLSGRRFFKGIGVRPTTELTYDLGGAFTRFEALCGIDDEVLGPGYGRGAGTGSVVFVVKVDGRQVFASEPVEGGRDPVLVQVPVGGAKRLTLAVTLVPTAKMPNGLEDSPELDNAVWARPLLIR